MLLLYVSSSIYERPLDDDNDDEYHYEKYQD